MSDIIVRRMGTMEDISVKYKSFEEMITDVRSKIRTVECSLLKARWLVGWQAFIVMEEASYGDHSIDEFARKLDLSASSVYECKRFYETFSKEQLAVLVEHGLPYRKALMLTRCDNSDQRAIIEAAAVSMELCDNDIKRLIEAANDGETFSSDTDTIAAFLAQVDIPAPTAKAELPAATGDAQEDEEEEDASFDPDELEDEDSDAGRAAAPSNPEDAIVTKFSVGINAIEQHLDQIGNGFTELINILPDMDALTPTNYAKVEKLVGDMAKRAQGFNMAIYKLIKVLADRNIRPSR